jgi:hypothetical protein
MILLLNLLVVMSTAVKFKFDVLAGQTQCFNDDLPKNFLIYGSVISNSSQYTFSIAVICLNFKCCSKSSKTRRWS